MTRVLFSCAKTGLLCTKLYKTGRATWLGFDDALQHHQDEGKLERSPSDFAGGTPSVWVIPTDEESVIAAGTLAAIT